LWNPSPGPALRGPPSPRLGGERDGVARLFLFVFNLSFIRS
jgi:hypothetical protein